MAQQKTQGCHYTFWGVFSSEMLKKDPFEAVKTRNDIIDGPVFYEMSAQAGLTFRAVSTVSDASTPSNGGKWVVT